MKKRKFLVTIDIEYIGQFYRHPNDKKQPEFYNNEKVIAIKLG